jgi:hypothetical protein
MYEFPQYEATLPNLIYIGLKILFYLICNRIYKFEIRFVNHSTIILNSLLNSRYFPEFKLAENQELGKPWFDAHSPGKAEADDHPVRIGVTCD